MNINIIAVGKIKEAFIRLGVDEFLKRIKPYSAIKVTEIADETIRDESMMNKILNKEGERILNQIPEHAYVVTMEIEGKQLSSENLAQKIQEVSAEGINQLVFVIGGTHGLSEDVKKRANFSLSMSHMTFPHQIARFILLEQVYRAYKIINNEPYHK